jgi:hypothetical protein
VGLRSGEIWSCLGGYDDILVVRIVFVFRSSSVEHARKTPAAEVCGLEMLELAINLRQSK